MQTGGFRFKSGFRDSKAAISHVKTFQIQLDDSWLWVDNLRNFFQRSIFHCTNNGTALPDNHFYGHKNPTEGVGDEIILAAISASFTEFGSKSDWSQNINRDVEDSARFGDESLRWNCNGRWILVSISLFLLQKVCSFTIKCRSDDETRLVATKIMITPFFTETKLIILDILPKGRKYNQLYFVHKIFPDLKKPNMRYKRRKSGRTSWVPWTIRCAIMDQRSSRNSGSTVFLEYFAYLSRQT